MVTRSDAAPERFVGPGVVDVPRTGPLADALTVASIAVLAFAFSNVLHEGVGHGGACLLVGGTPRLLTSASFGCDVTGVGPLAGKIVAAGGTIVNLAAGALAAYGFARRRNAPGATRWFLWLFASINVMQGFGYFLFSGVARIGDWAAVMADVQPGWLWRVVLSVGGFALYWLATERSFAALGTLIGGAPAGRYQFGRRLAWIAYLSGAALYVVAGSLDPGGFLILAISAAAASLGGTSGLAWGPKFLRGERAAAAEDAPALRIARDMRIAGAAFVVALLFVVVLGPGVHLG